MSKCVIIHGGLHKTGTTAFQERMKVNAKLLASHGVHWAPGLVHNVVHDFVTADQAGRYHSPGMETLLRQFEATGLQTLLMSAERFSYVDEPGLLALKDALKGYEVRGALAFRHPIKHAMSRFCNRGNPQRKEPRRFLLGNHTRFYNYADIAARWSRVFPDGLNLYRYEDWSDSSLPILAMLGLERLEKDMEAVKARQRQGARPETVLVNQRLLDILSGVDEDEYRERVYNNLLAFEDTSAFDEIVKSFGPTKIVFKVRDQETYLSRTRPQLERLDTILGPASASVPDYREPIRGRTPNPSAISALTERFILDGFERSRRNYMTD